MTGKTVGIDVGVKDTIVLSTGEKLSPRDDRDMEKKQARVDKYQRRLSKKQPGSKNFAKARTKLGKAHAEVDSTYLSTIIESEDVVTLTIIVDML